MIRMNYPIIAYYLSIFSVLITNGICSNDIFMLAVVSLIKLLL